MSPELFITLAMIRLMLHRLEHSGVDAELRYTKNSAA